MEFRQLRSLCKIVEHKNFTRAAEALRITRPALGLQIRNLEEELRVPLLVRHSRGVELTAEGKILYERAQVILGNVEKCPFRTISSSYPPVSTTRPSART